MKCDRRFSTHICSYPMFNVQFIGTCAEKKRSKQCQKMSNLLHINVALKSASVKLSKINITSLHQDETKIITC